MMDLLVFSFFSFIATSITALFLIKTKRFHISVTGDTNSGPQKIHQNETIRIGGLALYLSYAFVHLFLPKEFSGIIFIFLTAASIAFVSGFLEDITKKIKPFYRLLASILTGIIFIIIFDIRIDNVDIELINFLFENHIFSFTFTVLCIAILTQSTNIIDGLNGLTLGYAAIVITSILLVSIKVEDEMLKFISIFLLGGLIGIFVFNFPKPYIFLGDGGAYFIGALLSFCMIFLVTRNDSVSPFYCLLLASYPVYETVRSFFRRLLKSKSKSFSPDQMHLHSLVHKFNQNKLKILNSNSYSSFLILLSQAVFLGLGFYYYEKKWVLIIISLFFILQYELCYFTLIKIRKMKIYQNIRRKSE